MKPLIAALLLAMLSPVYLEAAVATISFDGNNPPNTSTYVAEQKQADGTWKEVNSAMASPIVVQISSAPGVYTFRVKARLGTVTSAPSNEASGTISAIPNVPTNVKAVISEMVFELQLMADGTLQPKIRS